MFGDSTENAIILAADALGIDKSKLDLHHKRLNEIPFDSNRKRMSTVYKDGNDYIQVTKGAFDFLLPCCTHIYKNGKSVLISQNDQLQLKNLNQKLTNKALRVIAIATKNLSNPKQISESSLTFLGLIGMIDPPRPEVFNAIQTCNEAGILPIMITGDHIATATTIGKELGIIKNEKEATTGNSLDNLSDDELKDTVLDYHIYSPRFSKAQGSYCKSATKSWAYCSYDR